MGGAIELKITYNIQKNSGEKLRIFGQEFVKNNKNNCKIKLMNRELDIEEYFDNNVKKYNIQNSFEIELIKFEKVNNFSCMFKKCYSLTL